MHYVAGDMPLLQVTVVDEDDGTAIDLTGATVTLRWRVNGAAVQTGAMAVTNAAGGICQRRWGSGELSAEGHVLFEVLVVDSSSNRYTSQQFSR
mgnify:CR=1 FL=1